MPCSRLCRSDRVQVTVSSCRVLLPIRAVQALAPLPGEFFSKGRQLASPPGLFAIVAVRTPELRYSFPCRLLYCVYDGISVRIDRCTIYCGFEYPQISCESIPVCLLCVKPMDNKSTYDAAAEFKAKRYHIMVAVGDVANCLAAD